MSDCIFCKIAAGEIPARKAYEDEDVLAFYDIDAKAPVHVLVIPKKHLQGLMELTPEDDGLLAGIYRAIQKLAVELGVAESGFRVVCNTGAHAGQSVAHLHVHLLGGREMGWPPG